MTDRMALDERHEQRFGFVEATELTEGLAEPALGGPTGAGATTGAEAGLGERVLARAVGGAAAPVQHVRGVGELVGELTRQPQGVGVAVASDEVFELGSTGSERGRIRLSKRGEQMLGVVELVAMQGGRQVAMADGVDGRRHGDGLFGVDGHEYRFGVQSIRNFVDVRPHPTVVRLGESLDAAWIRETYRRTDDVDRHLSALRRALAEPRGTGAFLIGHYGAGKSHFLAWVAQTLRAGEWGDDAPDVVAVSLVNFPSEARLEAIVGSALGVTLGTGDRRESWAALMGRHANGLLLVIDELSEFLRSKPDARRFNEDVRFLQFMGEWAQGGRFWVMAAVQEAIEHIGDLESGHYRKIKDRFPLRLHLTPGHVRDLIAHSVLVKRPGYDDAVATLVRKLEAALPGADVAWHELAAICPLHPATLELLEEVRDRFSQTRGVVDFVTARLAGDAARGLEPFVDRPWGELVTPDHIVEHFRDVFELQSEFQPFAQRVFPWYAKHLEALFPRPKPRALALRLIRLLTLVHLSPTRECLGADEATSWLLFAATRLEPERNRAIVERALDALVERGRYVKRVGDAWRLDLADDGGEGLERLVQRELAELPGDEVVGELLADAFAARGSAFDPAALPRERWLQRRFRWCFHERIWSLYVGHDLPPTVDGPAICVRLPWGESASVPSAYTVRPRRLVLDPPLRELAALVRLRTRPLPPEMMRRLIQRVHERRELWSTALRAAYADATIETPDGAAQPGVPLGASDVTDRWLDAHAELVLRRLYPRFESFAPTAGPLAKSHFVAFLEFVEAHGIGERTTNDRVDQLREAYLVPMGLLERRAGGLQVPARLDRHELVRLVLDMAAEHVAPRAVYRRLSEPVHGLVPDQIHVLLVFLLAVGEVDLRKADRSMRAMYAAAPLPDMYDRIAPGRALGAEQLRALEQLGAGLHVNLPRQWTVSAQRRVVAAVRGALEKRLGRLRPVCDRLESDSEAVRAIAELAATAAALDAEDPIEGVEAFLDRAQSVARFLTRLDDLGGLPERVDRQLAEGRRFEHLLRQPGLESVARELGAPPGLDDGEGFDRWLARAQDLHAAHVDHYRRAHDAWWHARDDAAVWHWSPPAVARARHVGLIDDLRALTDLQARARAQRCGGLGNLEFQARCACGFDGETGQACAGR